MLIPRFPARALVAGASLLLILAQALIVPAAASSGPVVVVPIAGKASLTSSANPSVYGQPVTFSTVLVPDDRTAGEPTGTVTFVVDGKMATAPLAVTVGSSSSAIGGVTVKCVTTYNPYTINCTIIFDFARVLSVTPLAAGSHTITATYNGSATLSGSTTVGQLVSPPVIQRVLKASTRTRLGGGRTTSFYGQAVTFTATVTANAPGAGTPTGTLQVIVDGKSRGPALPVKTHVRSASAGITIDCTWGWDPFHLNCKVSAMALPVGTHVVKVVYRGDVNHAASVSQAITRRVVTR